MYIYDLIACYELFVNYFSKGTYSFYFVSAFYAILCVHIDMLINQPTQVFKSCCIQASSRRHPVSLL